MAIEPLSSVMSFQAQNTGQTKSVQKQPAENKDVATPEQTGANTLDATTAKIAAVDKKDNQNGQNGDSPREQQQASNEQIKKAVESLNKNMAHSEAIFGIHDETNRVTIKIINRDTKEVIKELPPEKTLDMIAKVWEIAGIMVDERR